MSGGNVTRIGLAIAGLMLVASCVNKPTRVVETPQRLFSGGAEALAPVKIDAATVIIDARDPFEYSVAHVPKSISMRWAEFSDPERPGLLQNDLFAIARRLARAGIAPNTHVVVVGDGLKGNGAEGKIAWALAYLGVSSVQFANLESLKFRVTNVIEDNHVPSVGVWKPEPIESLLVSRDEVVFAINEKATMKAAAFQPGDKARLYRIIDTRPEKNYLGQSGFGHDVKVPNLEAINIPWQDFFDPALRTHKNMAVRLKEVGILPDQRIIVLCEDGAGSAAVTLALRALGFEHTGNYAGGLKELLQ